MMSFSEWIESELNKRGWSRSEAARRGGISPSMMDKVINGNSTPGLIFYKGLSKAFKISLFEILVKAGEITNSSSTATAYLDKFGEILPRLTPEQRDQLLKIGWIMLDAEGKSQIIQDGTKKTD